MPAGANVDGFDRVDATHFYLSFTGARTVPGLGAVQDEDVVFYNDGTWSLYFDGTAHGLGPAHLDLDAISVVGGTLYFSTEQHQPAGRGRHRVTTPTSTAGTAASSYTRVVDASANGLAAAANVDGLVWVDATHLYLSFSARHDRAGSRQRCRTRTSSTATGPPGRSTSTAPPTA